MKKSDVLNVLDELATEILTGVYPCSNRLSSLLTVQSVVYRLFGCDSPERNHIDQYVESLPHGSAFVGPLQSGGVQ